MTAPLTLDHRPTEHLKIPPDDVLSLIQDVLAAGLETPSLRNLAENAERLAARAGYRVLWEANAEDFQIMVDPCLDHDVLLKPALIHQSLSGRNVLGVLVRGQTL